MKNPYPHTCTSSGEDDCAGCAWQVIDQEWQATYDAQHQGETTMEHEIHVLLRGVWSFWQRHERATRAADALRGLRLSRPEQHWRVITYY